jgi:molybdopterin-guanine dinucleotide biosynthesis protein A
MRTEKRDNQIAEIDFQLAAGNFAFYPCDNPKKEHERLRQALHRRKRHDLRITPWKDGLFIRKHKPKKAV